MKKPDNCPGCGGRWGGGGGVFNQCAYLHFLIELKQSRLNSLALTLWQLQAIIMSLQAILIVLLSSAALSASQSCGTATCTQEYDNDCDSDLSSDLYDNCNTTQSSCSESIGPADNL